ncbi:MAG: hypothetical protein E7658_02360 [Ruminococcaceae bacterium]|nr:hypothetical protein [Oscillospiraceae bacterium]
MKRTVLVIAFTLFYALSVSFGCICLLQILGIGLALSLDGGSVLLQYPRFLPFCAVTAILDFAVFCILVVLHTKAAAKFAFTKTICCLQIVSAVILALPLMELWDLVFDRLHIIF